MPSAKPLEQLTGMAPNGSSPVSQSLGKSSDKLCRVLTKAQRKRKAKAKLLKRKAKALLREGVLATEGATDQSHGSISQSLILTNAASNVLPPCHGSSTAGSLSVDRYHGTRRNGFGNVSCVLSNGGDWGYSKVSDSTDGNSCGQIRLIPKERIIALDCEMVEVGTEHGGSDLALARCSIVDYDGNVVYDAYVRPERAIRKYLTRWSGIRPHHMETALPFVVAQRQIRALLDGKILVGHSLSSDFKALQLWHPDEDVRDTSIFWGLRQLAGMSFGPKRHPGLKKLTQLLFGRTIQIGEHCSVEDSRATMNLYKLVERVWEEEESASTVPFRKNFMDDRFWPDDLHK